MWAGDRPVATARVWHLAASETEPPAANGASGANGGDGSPAVEMPADLPEPQPQRYFDGDGSWGYGRATEWRTVSGGFGGTTGAGDVWTRLRIPLIAGRPLIHIYADENPGNGFEPVAADLEDVFFTSISRLQ